MLRKGNLFYFLSLFFDAKIAHVFRLDNALIY